MINMRKVHFLCWWHEDRLDPMELVLVSVWVCGLITKEKSNSKAMSKCWSHCMFATYHSCTQWREVMSHGSWLVSFSSVQIHDISYIHLQVFFTMYRYITNSQQGQLPVGLIAQLVQHCTCIEEVMGSVKSHSQNTTTEFEMVCQILFQFLTF